VRLAWVMISATLGMAAGLGGCSWFDSSDKPATTPATATNASEETMRKNCVDPKWKEQNLGLWYSVCRQPMRW
jgi:hypothetical protein